jgi:hypothetical protein
MNSNLEIKPKLTNVKAKREQFFETLFSGLLPDSQIEFRLIQAGEIPSKAFFFIGPNNYHDYIDYWNGKKNIYFGIFPRLNNNGTDTGIKQLTCGYIDNDVKKDHQNDWGGCLYRLKNFEFRPSVIVKSGNGLHCYWVFKEPVAVTEETSIQIKEIINGLAHTLKGDVNVIRLCHLFRVPETWNTKVKECQVKCELIEINENRYSINDFDNYRYELDRYIPKEERVSSLGVACKEDVDKILTVLEIPPQSISNNQIIAYCPFHEPKNSPSFRLRLDTGEWFCHSTSCEEPLGGGIRTFWKKWNAIEKDTRDKLFRDSSGRWVL